MTKYHRNHSANYFGHPVYTMDEMRNNPQVCAFITEGLHLTLGEQGFRIAQPDHAVAKIFDYGCAPAKSTERQFLHEYIKSLGVQDILPCLLSKRAQLCYEQIKNEIRGKNYLDFGCGDGAISECVYDHAPDDGKPSITLADVYQHEKIPHLTRKNMHFYQLNQGEQIPINEKHKKFDTAFAITVLHHSDNPEASLEDLVRLTKQGGRVILIESVPGILPTEEVAWSLTGKAVYLTKKYQELCFAEQFMIGQWFDLFYNSGLTNPSYNVNVPFNFTSPDNWNKLACSKGLQLIHRKNLGLDQTAVLEFHTLHVFEKL